MTTEALQDTAPAGDEHQEPGHQAEEGGAGHRGIGEVSSDWSMIHNNTVF